MKKPSTDLFDLVQSLQHKEIKHFRQHLRSQDSLSARIFEHILDMPAYDEAALRAALPKELSGNQLSVAKHYLFHSLLAFLLHREQLAPSAWKIRTRLQLLEILYAKELFDHCDRMLIHIERAARQLDDPNLLHEVYLWEFKLADRRNHAIAPARFEALAADFLQNAQRQHELAQLHWMYQDFFFRLRNQSVLRPGHTIEADFQHFFDASERQADFQPHSLAGSIAHDYTHATYAFMRSDMAQALARYRAIVTHMEGSPGWISLRPELYMDSLFRIGVILLNLGEFAEVEGILGKIKAAKNEEGHWSGRLFFYECQLERSLCVMRGPWHKFHALVERFEAEIDARKHRLSPAEQTTFRFNNGLVLFLAGEYNAAKKRFHDIVNADQGHTDFELITKALLLLIAEQQRDHNLYRHYHRSIYRQLHKQPGRYRMEEALLSGIGRVYAAKTQQDKGEAWRQLQGRLQEAAGSTGRAILYFDYVAWVKGQAEGRTFEEIYLEKVQQFLAGKGG